MRGQEQGQRRLPRVEGRKRGIKHVKGGVGRKVVINNEIKDTCVRELIMLLYICNNIINKA